MSGTHNRRDFIMNAAAAATAAITGQLAAGPATAEQPKTGGSGDVAGKPNIIFILADDLGYGDLGCFGQKRIKTPCLDRMAAEGMKLTSHYSGSTVCAPSRATLMTGLHTGHLRTSGQGQSLLPSDVTVAELLKAAGYATAGIGKWGLGRDGSAGVPNKQGFDSWFGFLGQGPAHFYYPEYVWRNSEKFYLEANRGGKTGTYIHDVFTDEALKFIRAAKDKPFFLYLPYIIPHAEMTVPADSLAPYRGKFKEKPYTTTTDAPAGGTRGPQGTGYCSQAEPYATHAGMISRMDRDIGRIFTLLKELGLDENTLVLFTSDNGPHGEGGTTPTFFNSAGPLRGMKRSLHDGGIRVPTIARWPGKIAAGSASDHASAFWDFLPTACEIVGIDSPTGIDGVSYLPALLGKPQEAHDHLYWDYRRTFAIRAGKWKAIRPRKGKTRLYDLDADIGETTDIAGKHPDRAAEMDRLFDSIAAESAKIRQQ